MMKLSNKPLPSFKEKIVLFDIDYTLFDTDFFKLSKLKQHKLFDEVEKTLEQLSKIAQIGIFSEGDIQLQLLKLDKTEVMKYLTLDHIYVVEHKEDHLDEIFSKYKNYEIFLVDDKLTVLYKASKVYPPLFTIWLKRGRYALFQEPIDSYKPKAIIEKLNEVIPIVSKN